MEIIENLKHLNREIKEEICRVEGRFLHNCIIDNKKYWDIEEYTPIRLIPNTDRYVLSSDWRYREDLIWLSHKETSIAH